MIAVRPFELWLVAAVILLIIEVVTGTFLFLSFCFGLLAVAAIEALTAKSSFGRDALIFAVVATLTIFVLRFIFRGHRDTKKTQGDVNDY